MGIISVDRADRLFWLGRYTERVYTTIRLYSDSFDELIDGIADNYVDFCKMIDIPDIYGSKEVFEEKYPFDEMNPDLIVLAGFLVVIPPEMIAKYRNRIINIHPSLIPAFCGTGFYGLKVHEAALERGVKVVGATVHFVDEGTDTGPIILQKAVNVEQGDTPSVLQRRVMEQAEWKILPQAIDMIANDKIKVGDGKVIFA